MGREDQHGEITVSREGQVNIPLEERPERVECRFKHRHQHPPCHIHDDMLRFEVIETDQFSEHHRHHRWNLLIVWSVLDLQVIEWRVEY
jgi:hypothetical protein